MNEVIELNFTAVDISMNVHRKRFVPSAWKSKKRAEELLTRFTSIKLSCLLVGCNEGRKLLQIPYYAT